MSDATPRRDDEILQSALELEAAERATYVDACCAPDPAQRDRVRALLDAHERAGDFLARIPESSAPDPWIGSRVGPWEIASLLGEGGAGRVYEARRVQDDFAQTVAVKILRRGIDHADDIRRFRTECAALARLDHPSVARLIDGGMLDDHHPYLVMERIDGSPLHEHCDRGGLSVEARLALFLEVCGAVDYAHRNLVIHRDLKPSNILVDADGRVKLLDFGVAKLLAPGDEDATRTLTTHVRLTPRYASPEQLAGKAIDTLSDVYSLGVLLYEILSGSAPYAMQGTTSQEWIRIVERSTVERPSASVGPGTAATHGVGPRTVSKRLRGDLDNIVLKALERKSLRRYASPRDLADDIRRHLDGRPVQARPDSFSYRLSKAARRNPFGVFAGGLALLALVIAAVVSTVSLTNVRSAQRESEVQRRTAERTVEFMDAMIASADPERTQSREAITVLELLGETEARIETELADEPVVAARMYGTLGRAYRGLEDFDRADAAMYRSLGMHRELAGPRSADTIRASTQYAELSAQQGDLDRALATVDSALAPLTDAPASARLPLLSLRSDFLARQGKFDAAITTGERALTIAREQGDDKALLYVANNVGLAYTRAGRPLDSVTTFREAVEIATRLRGEEHSETGRMHSNLGYALRAAGRPEEAIPELERALEIYESVYEPDNNHTAITRSNLADVQASTEDFESAIANQRLALATFRRSLGAGHINVGHVTHNLGVAYMLKGDYGRAIGVIDSAIVIYRDVLGDEHPTVAAALYNRARSERRLGDSETARTTAQLALDIREATLEDDHPDIARSSQLMGGLLVDEGRSAEALPWLERAAQIRRVAYAEDNMMRIDTERELASCLAALSRFEEAEARFRVAYDALLASRGPDDEKTIACREQLEGLAVDRDGTPR